MPILLMRYVHSSPDFFSECLWHLHFVRSFLTLLINYVKRATVFIGYNKIYLFLEFSKLMKSVLCIIVTMYTYKFLVFTFSDLEMREIKIRLYKQQINFLDYYLPLNSRESPVFPPLHMRLQLKL
jgi:hypothetical protein